MTLLLAGLQTAWSHPSFALPDMQSACIEQTIGDAEVIANQALDVNQDGLSDQVVLYINADSSRNEDPPESLYILLIIVQPSGECEIAMNEYLIWLTLTTGRQVVNLRMIEMIELTGDDKPELHVWLEKSGGGGGPRDNVAFHAIYTPVDGVWKHTLGNAGITQCLAFSSFEFRDAPTGDAKDIYLDEDVHCEPPWSFERTYTIMRWNDSPPVKC